MATPYIQMGGWLIIAIPACLSATKLFSDAQAFEARLTAVEQAQVKTSEQYDILGQKLDLVVSFMRHK